MYSTPSIMSGLVLLSANLIYIISTWRGKTKPTRGSWITWATLDVALIVGMYLKDTLNGQMVVSGISTIVVACMSLRWGKPGWTWLEKMCLAILPFGILLSVMMDDAVWNIGITLGLIAMGTWPTYESIWTDPARESRAAWTLAFVSSVIMLFGIHTWTFSGAAQPIVWFVTQLPILYLLWIPRR